jgi:hypothetical protein
LLTPKHIENSSTPYKDPNPPEFIKIPPTPPIQTIPYTVEMHKDQEDFEKSTNKYLGSLSDELALVYNEIWQLKRSLEESRKEINELKKPQPTLPPPTHTPPHDIVSWQASEEYKADVPHPYMDTTETCNPRYIINALNMHPKYMNAPLYHEFFSINEPYVEVDFDEFENLKDVADNGKSFVIDHILKYVKKAKRDGITMPFVYRKGNWYIHGKTGWEQQEKTFNKGLKPDEKDYRHNDIKSSFIFILHNRFNSYCDEKYDGSLWGMSHEATRIITEVFRRELFSDKEVMSPLITILSSV